MIVVQKSLSLKHGDVRQMRTRRLMIMRLSKQLFSRPPVISPVSLIKFSVIATVFLLLESCATFTEYERAEREYMRENSLVLAQEKYQRDATSCKQHGGAMLINRYSSARLGTYTAQEYKTSRCVKF
jgi:hypothetical protein